MKKVLVSIALFIASVTAFASEWKESQTIVLTKPTIHTGVTRTGNPKWYIVISDGTNERQVSVSKSNATAEQITLVKWVDENGKVKYSTRSAGSRRSKVANIDLNNVTCK